jgi:hypothetical protein
MAFIDAKSTKVQDRRYKVDLWLTDLNTVEIGILKQTQHRAKSRQFTKDMDVIGQIKEDGQRKGIVAYREGLWKEKDKMKKRLVIKLFTEKMNWRGTLDMMLGRSLQLTHGASGFPVMAFSINIADHPQIIQMERSAFKWPLFPEKYSFFIMKEDGPHFYRLRRKILAFGVDYILYDQNNRKIGILDGKVLNLGGAWKVRVSGQHADPRLDAVLQLFCAMLKFNDDSRRHILQLARGVNKGQIMPKLETQESDLYMNPRRTR